MAIKVSGVGDAMLLCPLPADYSLKEITEYIKKSDVSIVNLEMVLTQKNVFASTFCGGQWIHSEQENLDGLQKFGFDLYACANNHSMDFSFDGLIQTCELLEEKGIPYAGIGRSLDEASKPVYFETVDEIGNKKVVAMISVTTTFIDAARAGNGNDFFVERPGVNPLRHKEVYYVTEEQMQVLKQVASDTSINGERDNARRIGSLPPEKENAFNFGGIFFEVSEEKGKLTTCDVRDKSRILKEIEQAKEQADYVFVVAHSHQIKHEAYYEPDYFFEEFCHSCIDAGASCIIGGGTHQLKPIEMYKGRPIFYSLGNFIFQNHLVSCLPDDFWDKYGYSRELKVNECMAIKSKNGTIGLETDINNYRSVIPMITFEDECVKEITLLPITLNFEHQKLKGLPRIASCEETKEIFGYLQAVSESYGTEFRMEEGIIKVIM